VNRRALIATLAAVGLGALPQAALAQDPAALVEAAIPHDSAISEQYQRVQEVLDQAAAAVPDVPLEAAPAEPPAAPQPPPEEQYHSETPSNVSVTQQQPSNVNVSIRINSPGDDGPVVQINHAGAQSVVEQVVEAVQRPRAQEAPRPEPAAEEPPAAELPATWEWVWTSACFGGAPRAGAAAAVPGWSWRWSCDAADEAARARGPDDAAGLVPDDVAALVGDDAAALVPGGLDEVLMAAGVPAAAPVPAAVRRSEARARKPATRPDPAALGADSAGRPPPAPPPLARTLAASAAAPAAIEPLRHAARRVAARAGPGRRDGASSTLPAGTGPALGAVTALGTVASLLIGIWIAVLVTACLIVLPRLRHRRWTGPIWRLTRLPSSRLERPG
jgi:hypothetical protein